MPSPNQYRLQWHMEANLQLAVVFVKTGASAGDCYIEAVTEQHNLNQYSGPFNIKYKSFTGAMDVEQIQKFIQKNLPGLRGREIQDVLGIEVFDRDGLHILFDPPIEVRK